MSANAIEVKLTNFRELIESVDKANKSLDARWLKNTQRRRLGPMVNAMKAKSPSKRLKQSIGVTTAKRRAGQYGVKVGAVKDIRGEFEGITGPPLASIFEYGTRMERFRGGSSFLNVTLRSNKASTGQVNPHPFIRPAWDQHVGQFMDDVEDSILKKIEKEFEGG